MRTLILAACLLAAPLAHASDESEQRNLERRIELIEAQVASLKSQLPAKPSYRTQPTKPVRPTAAKLAAAQVFSWRHPFFGAVGVPIFGYPGYGGGGSGFTADTGADVLPSGCTDNASVRADGTGGNAQCSDLILGDTASNETSIRNAGANYFEIRGDRAESSSVIGGLRVSVGDDYASGGYILETGDAADTTFVRKFGVLFNGRLSMRSQQAQAAAMVDETTGAVSNSTAGPDDLLQWAGSASILSTTQGVTAVVPVLRITATGRYANNAETKRVILYYGGQALCDHTASSTSGANNWRMVAEVYRTGANTQDWDCIYTGNTGAAAIFEYDQQMGTGAVTDSATNIIKYTGTAATAGSIVGERLMVEAL